MIPIDDFTEIVVEVIEKKEEEPEVEVYDTTVEPLPDSPTAFEDLIEDAEGRLIVLDFQYDACTPCQLIAPEFELIKDTYSDVIFRKVDLWEHKDLITKLGVEVIPTFKIFVNGGEESSLTGSEMDALRAAVDASILAHEGHDHTDLDDSEESLLAQIGSASRSLENRLQALY